MGIFYFRVEAIPLPNSIDFAEVGGAYINCWVTANSMEIAKEIVNSEITKNNWKVLQIEEHYLVNNGFYLNDDKSYEYYEQAKIDGECYVYYRWPNEPQENSEIN